MAVYTITRFAASDMDQAGQIAEGLRSDLEGVGADSIDMVSYGNGKGVVLARYPDQETMDAAADTIKMVFGKMIEAGVVDGEIRRIVEDAYTRATKIIKDKMDDLHKLAQALVEYEMLTGDEIKALMSGEEIIREDDTPKGKKKSSVPKAGKIDLDDGAPA